MQAMFKISVLCMTFVLICAAGCKQLSSLGRPLVKRAVSEAELCVQTPAGTAAADAALVKHAAQAREKPDEGDRWTALGRDWVRKARVESKPLLYRNAQACATVALEHSPDDAAALGLRALVWLNEHRFAEVRELASAIVARDPDDAMTWGMLSDAELELGNLEAAMQSAQRMMDLKPNLPSYGRAAHLRWLQGDTAGAKRIYRQAIEAGRAYADREPSAWMTVQVALIFWHEGDYEGADAGLDLALAELPNYAPALEAKGRVALSRGDYPSVVRSLTRALELHASVESRWLLGDAYALLGNRVAAERSYARVVQDGRLSDPRTLALFYATKDRDPAEAVELAQQEYATRKDIYTKDALAWALYRAGDSKRADRLSRDAIATGTPDARLLYHAGAIRAAAGDAAAGRELMARAQQLNPRFDPLLLEKANAHAQL
jgi:tetratricopeptide (TPR) repeat protein